MTPTYANGDPKQGQPIRVGDKIVWIDRLLPVLAVGPCTYEDLAVYDGQCLLKGAYGDSYVLRAPFLSEFPWKPAESVRFYASTSTTDEEIRAIWEFPARLVHQKEGIASALSEEDNSCIRPISLRLARGIMARWAAEREKKPRYYDIGEGRHGIYEFPAGVFHRDDGKSEPATRTEDSSSLKRIPDEQAKKSLAEWAKKVEPKVLWSGVIDGVSYELVPETDEYWVCTGCVAGKCGSDECRRLSKAKNCDDLRGIFRMAKAGKTAEYRLKEADALIDQLEETLCENIVEFDVVSGAYWCSDCAERADVESGVLHDPDCILSMLSEYKRGRSNAYPS